MFRDHVVRATAVVLLGCGALGMGRCTGSSSPKAIPTTVAATTTSTLPPTTVYQPTVQEKSQTAAAAFVVAAWKAGDQATARADATPAAVAVIFAQPYPTGGIQQRGCSNAVAGPSFCDIRILATGDLLELSATELPVGWIISAARLES